MNVAYIRPPPSIIFSERDLVFLSPFTSLTILLSPFPCSSSGVCSKFLEYWFFFVLVIRDKGRWSCNHMCMKTRAGRWKHFSFQQQEIPSAHSLIICFYESLPYESVVKAVISSMWLNGRKSLWYFWFFTFWVRILKWSTYSVITFWIWRLINYSNSQILPPVASPSFKIAILSPILVSITQLKIVFNNYFA